MTDYRLRNSDLLFGRQSAPPGLVIAATFTAIGFFAMATALSGLTDRINPTTGFTDHSAEAAPAATYLSEARTGSER